jgi:hypothetical protein
MTTHPFDKKLMEFMYFLTRNQKIMSSIEMSKCVKINGKPVTDRTIRRWFKVLQNNVFSYFPNPKHECLGLVPNYVHLINLNDESILKIIPYLSHVEIGVDLKAAKPVYLAQYFIPLHGLKKFNKFWCKVRSDKLVDNFHVYKSRSATAIYSPFHKIIMKDGNLHFPEDSVIDNSYFISLLKKHLNNESCCKIHHIVVENPLITLILYKLFKFRYHSSHKLWYELKKEFGNTIWNYIKNRRIRAEKNDYKGIKYVQQMLRIIHNNFDQILQQLRLSYQYFCMGEKTCLYFILKLKNQEEILKISRELSKHTLQLLVHPPLEKKDYTIFYALTSNSQLQHLFSILLACNTGLRILVKDVEKSAKLDVEIKHGFKALFDPETCAWKYDHTDYMQQLDSLAKTFKNE